MDFFSGSKPNLISNNTLNELQNLMGYQETTIKDVKMNEGISDFYRNYIEPNLFFIILAFFFLLFLYWRYESKNNEPYADTNKNDKKDKKEKKERKEKSNKLEKIVMEDLIDKIEEDNCDKNLRDDDSKFVANFNPSVPVSVQQSYTNYMDDHVPLNVDGKRVTRRELNQDPEPKYEYLPFIQNKVNRGDTYTALYNDYNNYQDQNYPNPYGWEQNYNQSTFDAIQFATDKNRNNIAMLNNFVDSTNMDLMKNIM